MRKGTFLGIVALAFGSVAGAATYSFSTSTGAVIDPGTTFVPGSNCDDCVQTVALPFQVTFYNTAFNSVNVSSNGNIQFLSSANTWTNTALPAVVFDTAMMPHWDDLLLTGAGQGIYTSTTGAPGSQVFNIEWTGGYFSGGGTVDFEVRLYENQTYFDFVYGTVSQGGSSATVGVQSSAGSGDFTQYSFNTPNSLSSGLDIRWDLATSAPEPASFSLIGLSGLAAVAFRKFSTRAKRG